MLRSHKAVWRSASVLALMLALGGVPAEASPPVQNETAEVPADSDKDIITGTLAPPPKGDEVASEVPADSDKDIITGTLAPPPKGDEVASEV
ncbi:MAG: hypothetical protein K2Z25_14465, partial [Beijerinckiaceae bacterium]|nr:hypothetical protein [Beijerinckiaceae bacterium]